MSAEQASRDRGVCRGSLWIQQKPLIPDSKNDSKSKSLYYCVLVGANLNNYESKTNYQRGDHAVSMVHIVGASAWNPSGQAHGSSSNADASTSFRLVTEQGTHLYCAAPTSSCRDLWLGALHAGLDRSLVEEGTPKQQPLQPPAPAKTGRLRPRIKKHCFSCGAIEDSATNVAIRVKCVPVPHYGKESRCDLCQNCLVAQGLLNHVYFLKELLASAQHERRALMVAKQLCWKAMSDANPNLEREVQEAAAAAREDAGALYSAATNNAPTTNTSTGEATQEGSSSSSNGSKQESSSSGSWSVVDDPFQTQAWIHLPPTLESTKAVFKLVSSSAEFLSLQRISLTLETCCGQIQQGVMGVPDLLEQIENVMGYPANHDTGSGLVGMANQHAEMKKQAFRVAGDMGTAMKLLHDLALPRNEYMKQQQQHSNLDLFICLLEFLLDLCDGGELASVAAFWPQLCHIHLRMLPCNNIAELQRVELLEDFLLTVATKHSIHLALDLIWSHTADLEESFVNTKDCSPKCRSRRYSVLRFVCELESLLFGKPGGWGGGIVSLGKMFAPSEHQDAIIKLHMENVQELRKEVPQFLTRSVRMETLSHSKFEKDPEVAVQEAMRIARNADYFSSHLDFSRRLCDIAEKMFHIDIKGREAALESELELLNGSGTLGGDPLNRIMEHHIRVVGLPVREGHVFRSKERTPVLLLAEVFDDTVEDDEEQQISKQKETATSGVLKKGALFNAAGGSKNAKSEECDIISGFSPQELPTVPIASNNNDDEGDNETFEDAKENEEDLSAARIDLEGSHSNDEDGMYSPKHVQCSQGRSSPLPFEGSMDKSAMANHSSPHALKKFDAPSDVKIDEAPTPTKEAVGEIVTQTMVKQLGLPNLETQQEQDEYTEEDEGTSEAVMKSPARSSSMPRITSNESMLSSEERDIAHLTSKKMSALNAADVMGDQNHGFAPTGDLRRDVLNHIFLRGIQGSNTIAAGTQAAVQTSLQELEHRRAVELLMEDVAGTELPGVNQPDASFVEVQKRDRAASLGLENMSDDGSGDGRAGNAPTEDDEVLEAIRLLLIQNRVAKGGMTPVAAAKVLQHAATQKVRTDSSGSQDFKPDGKDAPPVDATPLDAGDIDPRLVGCGELTPAVQQALMLWKAGTVNGGELLELVKKDLEHGRQTSTSAESVDKLQEDSAFWGRFAFGERWAEKRARIALSSVHGKRAGWDLIGMIVKSNDDLRQEKFVMQLIELCQEAFHVAGLELRVLPYRIIPTGRSTGIIEMAKNAMSLDGLKKRPGYGKGGLREHLLRMTEFMPDPTNAFKMAQRNFVRSLAAYSLMSYFFLFKDRHNGNILLDTAGNVIHIDFGFVFGIAPGGSFSLEMSTPFKLTEEMVEVMDGIDSPVFSEFVILFCCGFLALQSHFETFLTLVEITSKESTFPCFEGRNAETVLDEMEARFRPDLDTEKTIAFALDIIQQATSSYGTKQYDYFQYLSQGIAT